MSDASLVNLILLHRSSGRSYGRQRPTRFTTVILPCSALPAPRLTGCAASARLDTNAHVLYLVLSYELGPEAPS